MTSFTKKLGKSFLEAQVSKGFTAAVLTARHEWHTSRTHRASLKRVGLFSQISEKKLNLGSGRNPKLGWINIDLFDSHADLQLDLRERWPFADATISHIYSEHIFEHFEPCEEVAHFLAESLRVLRPGGLFDVGVPDTEWPLRAYGDPEDPYWLFSETWHPGWCETQLDHINYHFRQGTEHKYAWDCETLAKVLGNSGFTKIVRRQFDAALDTEYRKRGTLYMRAAKTISSEAQREDSASIQAEDSMVPVSLQTSAPFR